MGNVDDERNELLKLDVTPVSLSNVPSNAPDYIEKAKAVTQSLTNTPIPRIIRIVGRFYFGGSITVKIIKYLLPRYYPKLRLYLEHTQTLRGFDSRRLQADSQHKVESFRHRIEDVASDTSEPEADGIIYEKPLANFSEERKLQSPNVQFVNDGDEILDDLEFFEPEPLPVKSPMFPTPVSVQDNEDKIHDEQSIGVTESQSLCEEDEVLEVLEFQETHAPAPEADGTVCVERSANYSKKQILQSSDIQLTNSGDEILEYLEFLELEPLSTDSSVLPAAMPGQDNENKIYEERSIDITESQSLNEENEILEISEFQDTPGSLVNPVNISAIPTKGDEKEKHAASSANSSEIPPIETQTINEEDESLELLEFLESEPTVTASSVTLSEIQPVGIGEMNDVPDVMDEITSHPTYNDNSIFVESASVSESKRIPKLWRWGAVVAFTALAGLAVAAYVSSRERVQAFDTAMAEGQLKRENRDYSGAIEAYSKALSVSGYSDDEDAMRFLAEAQTSRQRLADFDGAMAEGLRKREEKDYAGAEAAYSRALNVPGYADNKDAERFLADARLHDKYFDEFTAAMAEGQHKRQVGDYDGAIAAFGTALNIQGYSDNADASRMMRETKDAEHNAEVFASAVNEGKRLHGMKEYGAAVESFQNALNIPGHAENTEVAQLLRIAEGSERDLKNFISARDEGKRLHSTHQYDAAVMAFQQALNMPGHTNDAEVSTLLREANDAKRNADRFSSAFDEGKRRYEAREYASATEAFQNALSTPGYSEHSEATRLLREAGFASSVYDGRRLYAAKEYAAAAAAFRQALEIPGYERHEAAMRLQRDADFAVAFFEGRRQFEANEHTAAVASFRRATEIPGYENHEAAWKWLTHVLVSSPPPENIPEKVALDCGFGVALDVARIPAGSFMMGSPKGEGENNEKPQHQVVISQPFYIGVFPITQEQFESVMGTNPSQFKDEQDSLRRPVEMVSWNDAMQFCHNLSQKTGLHVRLPTEAEWEYACRAGISTSFHTGADITTNQANFNGGYRASLRRVDGREETSSVGSFQPNAWGLYDMHGNVWEWCSDWSGGIYPEEPVIDPMGIEKGEKRILRGGAWYSPKDDCRSAIRAHGNPNERFNTTGFRVAITLPTPELLAQAKIITPAQPQGDHLFAPPSSSTTQSPMSLPQVSTQSAIVASAPEFANQAQVASSTISAQAAQQRGNFNLLMTEGLRKYEAGDYTGAEEEIKRALSVPGYEDVPVAKQWLSAVQSAKEKQQAEAQLFARNRRNFDAMMVEGQDKYETGDYAGAMEAFRRASEIPGFTEIPEVKQWIAATQTAEGNRRIEAQRMAMAQSDFQSIMTDGQRRYEAGDYAGASAAFRRAQSIPGFTDAQEAKRWLAATETAEADQKREAQQFAEQRKANDQVAKKFFMGVAGAVLKGVLDK